MLSTYIYTWCSLESQDHGTFENQALKDKSHNSSTQIWWINIAKGSDIHQQRAI